MYILRKDIKRIVAYYIEKSNSRDPFDIAKYLNIQIQIGPLGSRCGCYMFLKNHRCIFLNENLNEHEMQLVMAHELAHAILHRKQNCYFIRNKTLLLNSKTEKEANIFAAMLLIPDEVLLYYRNYTTSQLSRLLGYQEKFIELRFNCWR